MPYEPNMPTESDRHFHYKAMWIGLFGSLISAANQFLGLDNMLIAMAYGAMAGGPLSIAFSRNADEYLYSLTLVGFRWMSAVLGIYLMALFLLATGDVANNLGFWLASGESQNKASSVTLALGSSVTATIVLSLAFHLGFGFAWLRDRQDTRS
ncbi:hypothetical protein [Parerythrobacter jejuensis]|uniref:Uncharacterized protein n=1 Tax=Parerythrobacter jejuensis TaxID=795812 RepID=A0A845ARU8_9SPHN|nr:hypothetical protein [Parerythrobacter jejuensis]MXP32314.1 hypothetical protein [Parerythrobacter jejuensis]